MKKLSGFAPLTKRIVMNDPVEIRHKDYIIRHVPEAGDGDYVVVAEHNGKQVGVVVFNEYDESYQSDYSEVSKPHRRKGVATAMYDYAEAHSGFPVVPASQAQTDDAIKFWHSRNKSKTSR